MGSPRRQPVRAGRRVGFGRLHRLRRSSPGPSAAAIPMPDRDQPGVNEPIWLMERDMSDEHHIYQQPYQDQPHQDFQPQPPQQTDHQGWMPQMETVQAAAADLVAPHVPAVDTSRLDAIEAAIQELRTGVSELREAHAAHPAALVTEAPAPVDPTPAAPAHDAHADRLAGIEATLVEVKSSLAAISTALTALSGDVESHKALHADTKALVDEQHTLMRGLNYIITSAIGTLTANAKAGH